MKSSVKITEKLADSPYVQYWVEKAGPELAEDICVDTLESFREGVSEGFKKGVNKGFAIAMVSFVIGALGTVGIELYQEHRKSKKS